ncbi:MAG: hypothetical protein LIO53_02965 [Oscillospiraceae bacterium]|nr:hypothetical protein [Oscillospiraceae bacterium]
MKQTLTNVQMEQMIAHLKPILSRRDKCGYVAARNTRILNDTLTEYFAFKRDLIRKFGTEGINEDGNPNGRIEIQPSSPNFKDFIAEFDKIAEIEHEVKLMTLTYDEVVGCLSGEEILDLDWMLEE